MRLLGSPCLRFVSLFTIGFRIVLSCFHQWPPVCIHDPPDIQSASSSSKSQAIHTHQLVQSVPHTIKNHSFFTNPCWTSHLQECDLYDLFRPSSGDVFLWNSAKVPALQGLVNIVDKGVNHLSHVTGEWIKRGLLGPWSFEMPILVALGTKQPLLSQSDV